MLKKIFLKSWFTFVIHFIILVGISSNAFYTLENFKVSKGNEKLLEQKSQLELDKKNLIEQNSYEFLENYKEKTIKKAGYKKTGEKIFDIANIDQTKDDQKSIQTSNLEKWSKCLFSKNAHEQYARTNTTQLEENQNTASLCK
jgi:hypothetical protein